MKDGKYLRIPEKPADIEHLWHESEPLNPVDLPEWVWPGEADSYRFVGSTSRAEQDLREQKDYIAEIKELEAAGLIADQDKNDGYLHHIYIPAPWWPQVWAIGIYTGESPLDLTSAQNISNPVLTRESVTDVSAVFVADPFMLRANHVWHMFFEVMN